MFAIVTKICNMLQRHKLQCIDNSTPLSPDLQNVNLPEALGTL